MEIYRLDHNNYPLSGWVCSYQAAWETGALGAALQSVLPTMPVDPTNQSTPAYNGGLSYCYYSSGYRASGQTDQRWYMLVFTLENANATLEAQDGSTACNGTFFNYGGEDGKRITMGGSC